MKKGFGFFATLALVALLVFLVISIVEKNIEINNLENEERRLETQKAQLTLTVEKLDAQLNREMDEETIKRIAREKLNLRDPGDEAFASDLPN